MQDTVTGNLRTILRSEGLLVLCASLFFYHDLNLGWPLFFLFFLVPDLSLLFYLWNAKIGAVAYNIAHSYIGPIFLLIVGRLFGLDKMMSIAIIWIAHIGFDRALGYGLKYSKGFGFTHLGRIGKEVSQTEEH